MIKLNLSDSYHFIFWEESKNQIECIEREMLLVESQSYTDETLQLIFRMAHSLKGSSATMEIKEMMRIAHVLEDLLTLLKNHRMSLSQDVMNLILEAIDVLRWLHELLTLENIFSSDLLNEIEQTISDVELRIKNCIHTAAGGNTLSRQANSQTMNTANLASNANPLMTSMEQSGIKLRVLFETSAEMLSVKAYIIVQALSKLGTIMHTLPGDYENSDDEVFNREFWVTLSTEQSEQELLEVLKPISELNRVEVIANIAETPIETKSTAARTNSHVNLDVTSVRISIQKINQLINLVGELTLNKEILFDVTKALKKTYKKDKQILRLEEACESIQYLGSELQEIVLNARLIPLEAVFSKFPRMVRDLAKASGKTVILEINGNEQGVDRSIIEELADPLMHLIRNAVDHGLESNEMRIQRNKSPEGHLKIEAWQGDNQVVITIEDDGNGIDLERIKVKALSKQMLSIEEAVHLTDEEWFEFIFKPGFSTANQVTTVSGRGVGLDVVKSNITKINGHIDLATTFGVGTKFIITLPLTMAIMNVLLVKEASCIFGIPTAQIVEIIRITEDEFSEKIYRTEFSDVLNWQETTIPMLYLSKVFSLGDLKPHNKLFVIILGTGERKMALVVGQILGEQEVVIKPMRDFIGEGKIFGELYEISGVSVLGNGNLAQIIDCSMFNKI